MGGAALSTLASQAAFRDLLAALAHPGRPRRLDVPAGVPAALMVPLALADLTQRVAVVGDEAERWGARLVDATGCLIAGPGDADQIVVLPGAASPALVAEIRRGSAVTPEAGARVSIGCAALRADGDVELGLRGPGVYGTATIGVSGCSSEVFDAIAAANVDFPAGIDVWLVATDGTVVGLPRSTRLEMTAWAM